LVKNPKVKFWWTLVEDVRTFFANGFGTVGLSHEKNDAVMFVQQAKRILEHFEVLHQKEEPHQAL